MGGTDDDLAIIRRRIAAQRLAGRPFGGPADAVRGLLAVQSQEYLQAKWALAMRCGEATNAEIDASFDRGDFLRTHVLRPTWHFVAPEDLRPLLRLTAPRVRRLMAPQDRELSIDEPTLATARRTTEAALEGGAALTRRDLAERLAGEGITGDGRRIGHITMRLELEALICSGPRDGKQHTYALVDERVPPETSPASDDDVLAGATVRFFAGHGPATAHDFAKWASLRVSDARAGLDLTGDRLDRFEHGGTTYWHAGLGDADATADRALLLPEYDESWAGYRDLRMRLAAPVPGRLDLRRPVLVGGEVRAAWRRKLSARSVDFEIEPFAPLSRRVRGTVEDEAEQYAAFLQLPIGSLKWVAS